MYAIYAFMRHSDDISDEPGTETAQRARFAKWRKRLNIVYQNGHEDDPYFAAFKHTVQEYKIPRKYFEELVDGTEMDLVNSRYQTFDDLYAYCYKVASVVGFVCLHVFGFEDEAALEYGEYCGIGFQLTNILRDIAEDAQRERIYLPLEDLERFGYPKEALFQHEVNQHFLDLMKFQVARARQYYEKAQPLLGYINKESRPALAAMMKVYGSILDRIEACDYDVFNHRPNPSAAQKIMILLKLYFGKWLPS